MYGSARHPNVSAPKLLRFFDIDLSLQLALPALRSRVVAAVRVGERRWNLHLSNGADVLLPEGAEGAAMTRLMELQTSQALLDRPLQVVDMRLPDRLVVRAIGASSTPAPTGKKPS